MHITKLKIKLPRKRKKEYMKRHGRSDYFGVRILNEILLEEAKTVKQARKAVKFPCLVDVNNRVILRFNY